MRRMRHVGAIACLALAFAALRAPAGAEEIAGRIEGVVLYRGQALVTRAVPVEGAAGPLEVAVTGLPEQVVPDSLFAEGGEGIEVRAVRYRARAVGENPREELRALEKQMEDLQAKIARNKKMTDVLAGRQEYLDKLEKFVAPTASVELSKGVLNAETLEKIATFSFEQRKASAEETLKLATEHADLQKQLKLLQRRHGEIASGAGKTRREAVLFLDKKAAGAGAVKLNYLVQNAGWSPSFNFYALSDAKEIRIEYNALIRQQTGEDWTGVSLTLSTAFPSLNAETPGLAPFRVALGPAQVPQKKNASPRQQVMQQANVSGQMFANSSMLQDAYTQFGQQQDRGRNLKFNWEMNRAAGNHQFLELVNPNDVLQRILQEGTAQNEGLSVSYAIGGTVGLASRSDQQLVRIFDSKLPARFFFVATPLLTRFVYRQAEITHTGAEALLGGPCSVYLDGRFVGRCEIPSVGRGEIFVVGFGAESQLRTRRDLVEKTESVQGGNREMTFRYRLILESFKETAVTVRVMDRLPVAGNASDIRITLGDMKDTLSEDPLYLRLERPKGILRWDIEVPAKASGEKARIVEFDYKVEFDRTLSLRAPGRDQEQQAEFMELQQQRILPAAAK